MLLTIEPITEKVVWCFHLSSIGQLHRDSNAIAFCLVSNGENIYQFPFLVMESSLWQNNSLSPCVAIFSVATLCIAAVIQF